MAQYGHLCSGPGCPLLPHGRAPAPRVSCHLYAWFVHTLLFWNIPLYYFPEDSPPCFYSPRTAFSCSSDLLDGSCHFLIFMIFYCSLS